MDTKSLEYFFNATLKRIYKYRESYRDFEVNLEQGYIRGSKFGRFNDLSELLTSPINKSSFESLVHEYLSHHVKSIFTINIQTSDASQIKIKVVFHTYFEELPTDVVGLIAAGLGRIWEIDSFCNIVSICDEPKFWIHLIKKDYPFSYKRDYPWKSLYYDILHMRSEGRHPWNLHTLSGFYVYEGLVPPDLYWQYINEVTNTGDLLSVKKIMEAYAKDPKILILIHLDTLLSIGLNSGNLDVIKELLKYNVNDVMKHEHIFGAFLSDVSSGYDEIVDFIFTYPDISPRDKSIFLLDLSRNGNYKTFDHGDLHFDQNEGDFDQNEGRLDPDVQKIVGIADIIEKYDIHPRHTEDIFIIWEQRPVDDQCDMLFFILNEYQSRFRNVDIFETLYDYVTRTILDRPNQYKHDRKIIQCIYGLLHNYPTYKRLGERINKYTFEIL